MKTMLILDTLDLNNHEHFAKAVYAPVIYVKDLNIRINNYRGSLQIIDLTNAMQSGKECNKVSFIFKGEESDIVGLRGFSRFLDDYPLADVVNNWRNGFQYGHTNFVWYDVDFCYSTIESKRVFSPFLQFKKQNLHPANGRIRVLTFVKAILAGQIASIVCDGNYTDDYYYDHATNYSIGKQYNLFDFAAEMLDCSGWGVWNESDNKNVLNVAFSTCSYYHAAIKQ